MTDTINNFQCEHCGRTFDSYQACTTYAWKCPDCSYSITRKSIIDANPSHPLHRAFPASRGTTASELNQMMVAAEEMPLTAGEIMERNKKFWDEVNSEVKESADPSHYKTDTIQCIDAMRAMLGDEGFKAYLRGTIFKYTWRHGRKDAQKVETEKMATYLRWLGEVIDGHQELSK